MTAPDTPEPRSPSPQGKPPKARSEIHRLISAGRYSWSGITTAFHHEPAVRTEIIVLIACTPLAWIISKTPWQLAILIGAILMVVVVELLNSAIEQVCDMVTTDFHPAIKKAKDYGSAAVVISIIASTCIWLAIAWQSIAKQ